MKLSDGGIRNSYNLRILNKLYGAQRFPPLAEAEADLGASIVRVAVKGGARHGGHAGHVDQLAAELEVIPGS